MYYFYFLHFERKVSFKKYLGVFPKYYRYATEVDVDFVRKSVRAIGRCAIKVEQAAERCVSTLLDLIQTKVNYVVQEAIVVIKVCIQKLKIFIVSLSW